MIPGIKVHIKADTILLHIEDFDEGDSQVELSIANYIAPKIGQPSAKLEITLGPTLGLIGKITVQSVTKNVEFNITKFCSHMANKGIKLTY